MYSLIFYLHQHSKPQTIVANAHYAVCKNNKTIKEREIKSKSWTRAYCIITKTSQS